METIRFNLGGTIPHIPGLSLALGTFDGFHKAHQKLLIESKLHGLYSGVLLFSVPPEDILKGPSPCLMGLEDKIRLLSSFGLDYCLVIEATPELFALSKTEFMDQVLDPIGMDSLVVGEDFRFGYRAEGMVKDLKTRYKTYVCPLLGDENGKISSTRVRQLLLEGDVRGAWKLLVRPYEIKGIGVKGKQNGGKIGFPTMNLQLSENYLLPKNGVYAGIGFVLGKPYKAMINVGDNPSIGSDIPRHIEVHLLGYPNEDTYGLTCYLGFLYFVREEKKFASLDELKKQLEIDKLKIESLLSK